MIRNGFMFAGQGAQYPGMGRQLYETSAAARGVFDSADKLLGYSIRQICVEGTAEELMPCSTCQPAIFVMSMAMHAAFTERGGDAPAVCGGLSLGEFSAACVAGVLEFSEALLLVAERGRLMDACCQAVPGGMAAVLGAPLEKVRQVCDENEIDVANCNCPGQVVISGEKSRLAAAMKTLETLGFRVVPLAVAGAYHSRLMRPAAEKFGEALRKVDMKNPRCGFVQNVTGGLVSSVAQIRENLQRQVASPVLWESCAGAMMPMCDQLLEFGPGNVLCGFMKRIRRDFPAYSALK